MQDHRPGQDPTRVDITALVRRQQGQPKRTVTANPPARGAAAKILKRRGQRPAWATVTKIRRL